jgi:hypothetical protein
MFKQIKEFFTGKPAEVVAEVPYKVEVANAPFSTIVDTADIAIAQLPTPEELKVVAEMTDAIHDTDKPVKKPTAKKAPAKKTVAKKPRVPKAPK